MFTNTLAGYQCPECKAEAGAVKTCPRCLAEQCPKCFGAMEICTGCDFDVRFRAAGGRLAAMPAKGAAVCTCNAENPAWDRCPTHAPAAESVPEADRGDAGEHGGGVLEPGEHDEGSPVGYLYQI